MSKYRHTQIWFFCSEIYKKIQDIVSNQQKINILEIGCFEGLSSTFFADNLLDHPESTLTCVDPFLNISDNDHAELLRSENTKYSNVESRFDYNMTICNHANKILVHKKTSDEFFETNQAFYDFMYIDGSHKPDIITRDMENSFRFLNSGGIMWINDYLGGPPYDDTIQRTMDAVLKAHEGEYEVIHLGYQLAIRKK